jgi:hypothetical protein
VKKHIIALLLFPLVSVATETCPTGGCTLPSDVFNPNLNNSQINSSTVSPTVVMPVNNTQTMGGNNSYSTIGSVSCAEPTVSLGVHTSKQGFGGKSMDNVGVFAGVNIPFGGDSCEYAQKTIVEVQQIQLQSSRMDQFAKLFKSCVDARTMGFDIVALARIEPALSQCPEILAAYTPPAPQQVQVQQVVQVVNQQPQVEVKKEKQFGGYRKYRVWLGNYSDCSACGRGYKELVSSLPVEVKSNLKILPFASSKYEQLFSVNVATEFNSHKEALDFVQKHIYPLNIPADVRGVKGTEIYR